MSEPMPDPYGELPPAVTDMAHLSERQALAFRIEAFVAETTVAKLRRRALAEYADRLLANPEIANIVRLAMLHRAREGIGRPALRVVGLDVGGEGAEGGSTT